MPRWFARLLFVPTLLWNMLWGRVLRVWQWYNRVDQHVLIGALPFASLVPQLHAEGVGAVVNMCEEYAGPTAAYERAGIRQLRVPTVDFTAPSLVDVQRAVAFMREEISAGRSVYVHCKAGRGRSATVVLCWLIEDRGLSPVEAQQFLMDKRSQVVRHVYQRPVVQEFYALRHGDKDGG